MSRSNKRYYITTPIYYVNGSPHIGTATTTVLADATKRYHLLRGEDAFFLTGTDENARKVLDAAAKVGMEPQAFVDEVSQRFVRAWQFLGCDNDAFFRTSDDRHFRCVQEVWRRLWEKGDIYKGEYEGWYSVSEETFFRDTDVDAERKVVTAEGPSKGAVVERVKEESFFFRLSAYGEPLRQYILDNPDFLIPETRKNEVLAFIDQGLRDLNITQSRTGWGIPIPGVPGKVVYVWFDALINYLTESGWPDDPNWETLWPADVHLMGKEIYTRFHATLWPATLMALGLPLPRHVVGHGWWLVGGEKMSKSRGPMPEPQEVVAFLHGRSGAAEPICIDALRYYLLRDIRFTDDAEFSLDMLVTRFNSDLANDLGNVLNRILRAGFFEGVIPEARVLDSELKATADRAVADYEKALERFDWGSALQSAWSLVSAVNLYFQEQAPWNLAKNGDTAGVRDAVYNALEGVRLACLLIHPVMPQATRAMASQLGLTDFAERGSWAQGSRFGALVPGTATGEATPLFPRIEVKKPVPEPKPTRETKTKTEAKPDVSNIPTAEPEGGEQITIDEFARVQFKVAEIVAAERIEGAKKLLKLQVRLDGDETRQIVSGIADAYAPEALVGKQIVVVANLKPAVLRGVESQGMLLAATDAEGRAVLLHPDKVVAPGSKVK
ncbi:MAG: methionine--tRNA ligase [Capsulimonadales bacterium]|nr:methionine--tRNA ligase [Capsulimonadales bacterium]